MPRYFYLDPHLEATVPPSAFRAPQTTAESDTLQHGEVIEIWDHVFRWDDKCFPLAKANVFAHRGDALADAALPLIQGPAGKAGGTDLFARLEAAATGSDPPREVRALWHQLHATGPDWPSREQMRRGADVFHRYATQFLASLLHFSLSAGFASPDISVVLNLASYIVPPCVCPYHT